MGIPGEDSRECVLDRARRPKGISIYVALAVRFGGVLGHDVDGVTGLRWCCSR